MNGNALLTLGHKPMQSKEEAKLYSLAPCIGAEPMYFDQVEPNCMAEEALTYCARCPVKAECVMIVKPHESYFDGICGGIIWKNGRPVGSKVKPKPVTEFHDEIAIERLIGEQIDWKQVTIQDRRRAAILMLKRGIPKIKIIEITHLNGTRLNKLFKKEGL